MSAEVKAKIIISTSGRGISRAERNQDGAWSVDPLLKGRDVRSLAADPLNASIVYAGLQDGGILKSNDGGCQWIPAGLEGIPIKAIAVSKIEAGVIYAGSKSPAAICHSQDGGETWSELEQFQKARRWYWISPAEPPFSAYIQSIALSPKDPDLILVGIEAGAVLRSEDGGASWSSHLKGALRDCHTLIPHQSDGSWFFEAGGSGGGAAFSSDGGRTWNQPKEGLDKKYGWACAADPLEPSTWYVSSSTSFSFPQMTPTAHIDGQANGSIYRKRGHEPWQKLAGGLPEPLDYMAYALQTDPTSPGHLYAGLSNGDVWHTADYGDSWQQLGLNLGGIHRQMIVICDALSP